MSGKPAWSLRCHQPADLAWVSRMHGIYYGAEGWDPTFETFVAQIAADFIRNFNPLRERCWIAEMDGQMVGSVCLVGFPDQEDLAKLRLLIVDPKARGLGIGKRLVRECTHFARQAGYRRITLWTNDILLPARKIYADEGYRLVHAEAVHRFGRSLVDETWELDL